MYFNKYYSYKTKGYIYKTILTEDELFMFKHIVKKYMPEVEYNKISIRRLNIENEYKYIKSPNSIGEKVLDEIKRSSLKHYMVELTKEEQEEMYEQFFKASVLIGKHGYFTDEIVKDLLEENEKEKKEVLEELEKHLKSLGLDSIYN